MSKKKRPKSIRVGQYTLKPISEQEFRKLRTTKEDMELRLAWNLRVLPFLIRNYEVLEKYKNLQKRIKRRKKHK